MPEPHYSAAYAKVTGGQVSVRDEIVPDAGENRQRSLREKILRWAPLAMVLAGVLFLVYPLVATQHNNAEQQRIASGYSASADNAGPDVVAEQLRKAREYNDHLASMPILDPWLESQRPDTPGYQDYLSRLNLNDVMARVTIPRVHIDLPVYHGTEDKTLAKGVGHLFGTSLPVGGASTHAVLTGHTGLGNATMFDELRHVEKGDVFYVETLGQIMKYQVNDIQVVLPNETDSLIKQAGRDLITLITCTPYGVNSHRLLVTGERVPMDANEAAKERDAAAPAPMAAWMIGVIIVVSIVMLILLAILVRKLLAAARRRKEEEQSEEPEQDSKLEQDSELEQDPEAGSEPQGER